MINKMMINYYDIYVNNMIFMDIFSYFDDIKSFKIDKITYYPYSNLYSVILTIYYSDINLNKEKYIKKKIQSILYKSLRSIFKDNYIDIKLIKKLSIDKYNNSYFILTFSINIKLSYDEFIQLFQLNTIINSLNSFCFNNKLKFILDFHNNSLEDKNYFKYSISNINNEFIIDETKKEKIYNKVISKNKFRIVYNDNNNITNISLFSSHTIYKIFYIEVDILNNKISIIYKNMDKVINVNKELINLFIEKFKLYFNLIDIITGKITLEKTLIKNMKKFISIKIIPIFMLI